MSLLLVLLGASHPGPRPPVAARDLSEPATSMRLARTLDTPVPHASGPDLVGQWRARLRFTSGAFASIKDLEFMYVFNQGGTMTESSNYDAAPPVPPAYGIWRRVGAREFEAKYEFYVTKAPAAFAEIAKGGGWGPAGRGVFVERITLSEDGRAYSSKITYDQFDAAGRPAEGGGSATAKGVKLGW